MFSLPNSGWIRKDKNLPSQQDMHYEMRSMNENDLEDIIELQSVVIQNMNDREIYRTHSIDYFIEHIQMGSYAIGTFTDDGLIAYSILYFPGENEDNFGRDILLPTEELDKVAQLATVAVHPAYRGNSLQKKMYAVSLDVAKGLGFQHACCMVSPKNYSSLQNIFSHGLFIKALKMKFDRRLRYIMHRHLDYSHMIYCEEIRINSTDILGQMRLLKKGFLGFGVEAQPRGFAVSYGKDMRSIS